ncbi:MAG: ABC transporter permease [Candidatus Methylacidiphilales bacterium]|nr:ABC transporter permease [Candidatus Methylacidiphilales bacterium]
MTVVPHRWVELHLALKFLRPKRSYVSAITILSLLGVLVGVAVLIVVLSVMEGFERQLREKIVGFNAHVTVTNYGLMRDYREVMDRVAREPGVVAVTPFILGPVLVESGGRVSTPFIKGIDPSTHEAVIPMKGRLVAGEWILGPDSVIVGDEWARRNQAWVGDKILVYSPRNLSRLRGPRQSGDDSYYLPSEYTIRGLFSTGFFEYDFNFLILGFSEAQRLYAIDDAAHGLAIRLEHALLSDGLKQRLNRDLAPPLTAVTWIDQNRTLVQQVAVERRVMFFILLFIMIVAAFGLMSTLITVTVQKTRDIGLLKALGARNAQVAAVFTLYGLVVGVAGSVLGVAAGLALVSYRNPFSGWLSSTFRIDVFPAEIYHFLEIPAVVDPPTVLIIGCCGVVLSTLAALIPALAAARIDPARSLNNP